MKIAISGAGVAGPALAYWLKRTGHEPVLIEKAPAFRSGGYVIDFWGVGYDVAERMGLLPEILDAGYTFRELRLVDEAGRRRSGFKVDLMRRMLNGRLTSLPRGDLAAAVYRAVADEVETLFGESISAIRQEDDTVHVDLASGAARDFDLVIGADGQHSAVRGLVFGPQEKFEKKLGYYVASFEVTGYRPRDELVYAAHAAPGRQIARFALRGDRTIFLFIFRSDRLPCREPGSLVEVRGVLRDVFGGAGWETPRILAAMEEVDDIYFDRVSQIRMDSWSEGRVALIGDAAAAVSLLAGEGTGLALTEAYVLAGELQRAGNDPRAAFRNYELRLRPFIRGKQKSAVGFASSFVPQTEFGIRFRNWVMNLMGLPGIASLAFGNSVKDDFELPDYGI